MEASSIFKLILFGVGLRGKCLDTPLTFEVQITIVLLSYETVSPQTRYLLVAGYQKLRVLVVLSTSRNRCEIVRPGKPLQFYNIILLFIYNIINWSVILCYRTVKIVFWCWLYHNSRLLTRGGGGVRLIYFYSTYSKYLLNKVRNIQVQSIETVLVFHFQYTINASGNKGYGYIEGIDIGLIT